MEPVVVVHVHEDGHRLAEDDATPHDDVPQLPSEEWDGGDDTQWDLCAGGEREREREWPSPSGVRVPEEGSPDPAWL